MDAKVIEVDGALGLVLPPAVVEALELQVGQLIQVTSDTTNTLKLQDHDISPEFMRGVEAAVEQYHDALTLLQMHGD
ncbi:hypothetical protein [Lactiplantibacillus daowaiensis]|uniref:SpoVT-AbrB domain-containing protein n=1 Tax=Lactiplantibacillus daowaiensis TaxID=2559918 RepID=A0ABW1RXK6_9LACO|nr:hypothetical protein [Lactiplantibacillus daowaiensis]